MILILIVLIFLACAPKNYLNRDIDADKKELEACEIEVNQLKDEIKLRYEKDCCEFMDDSQEF